MKKLLFFLLPFLALAQIANSQITFEKFFGDSLYSSGLMARQTNDGGYIVCGRTNSFGVGNTGIYVIKTDPQGNEEWSKSYYSINNLHHRFGNDIIETPHDNGYLISARYQVPSPILFHNMDLIKINSVGDTIWTSFIGYEGANYSVCNNAYYLSNPPLYGYLLSVATGMFYSNEFKMGTVRIDQFGDTICTKYLGEPYDIHPFDMNRLTDTTFAIAGKMFNESINRLYLAKIKWSGDGIHGQIVDIPVDYYTGAGIQAKQEEGYIIAGTDLDSTYAYSSIFLVGTNSNFDILWTRRYYDETGYEAAYDIVRTIDGGFVIVGTTNTFTPTASDVLIMKINEDGDSLWTKTYGNDRNNVAFSVQPTSDNGLIITGQYEIGDETSSVTHVYLLKTDENGEILWINDYDISKNNLDVFPNPFNNDINVSIDKEDQTLQIFDIKGKIVYAEMIPNNNNPDHYKLDLSHLSKGIYFIKVTGEKEIKTAKIIKD